MTAAEPVVVDTNVGIVANRTTEVSPECELSCVRALRALTAGGHLVLDGGDLIFDEYRNYLSLSGEPGTGDAFMRWVSDNRFNEELCTRVPITPTGEGSFDEFPDEAGLESFHANDRQFVSVSAAHPGEPPILVALDRGWCEHEVALAAAGVPVTFLCPDDIGC